MPICATFSQCGAEKLVVRCVGNGVDSPAASSATAGSSSGSNSAAPVKAKPPHFVCDECSNRCDSCQSDVCRQCSRRCKACREMRCNRCLEICASCSTPVHSFDTSAGYASCLCSRCDAPFCSDCFASHDKCA